jgi:threonine dehydratase
MPQTVEQADIHAALERVAPHLRLTPVLDLEVPTPAGPLRAVAKLESLQHTGSFKPRGAFNNLLQMDSPEVLACSGGNHGLAVAYAAQVLGRRARIVVPKSAARSKVEAMARCGAEVIQVGDVPADAFAEAERMAAATGLPLLHPYAGAATIAGQGTLGLELLDQAPEVSRWLVAVGGGGFPAGVALALAGNAEVVPVEPVLCPGLFEAQRAGKPVDVRSEGIARTSLGAPRIGDLAWELLKDRVAPTALVSEAAIAEAQAWLWREVRVAAEPGGAATLAALMSGAWTPPDGEAVGFVVCGGNVDALPA